MPSRLDVLNSQGELEGTGGFLDHYLIGSVCMCLCHEFNSSLFPASFFWPSCLLFETNAQTPSYQGRILQALDIIPKDRQHPARCNEFLPGRRYVKINMVLSFEPPRLR